jgi:hypothetical protein
MLVTETVCGACTYGSDELMVACRTTGDMKERTHKSNGSSTIPMHLSPVISELHLLLFRN